MVTSLTQVIEGLGRPRVLVLGDLILDRYVFGNAERISQEAPVILLRADSREDRLGGAASVASMLAVLDAEVILAGVVGTDHNTKTVRELLDQFGIDHSLVLEDSTRPTTVKERYIGRAQAKHPQQMMRVDFEERHALDAALVNQLSAAIADQLDDIDIILVSDYDKGVCTPDLVRAVIAAAQPRGVKVLVDPVRGGGYEKRYLGCTTMTPNRLEASQAVGHPVETIEQAYAAAGKLREILHMEVGIITLDKSGMVLVDRQGLGHHFPVRQRQVYDITGAGDMVLSVLGIALAAGFDYPEAIQLANVAGGLEVERLGVATLTRDDLRADLHDTDGEKLLTRETLVQEVNRQRGTGKRIVFTNGCFDILHAGHVAYLREAAAQGDVLVIGLNTDASVRRLGKGSDRPINSQLDRAAVLGALRCVDYVCLFDEDTPLSLIEAVAPDVLVKGADYRPEEVVGREFVESRGGRLHLAALVPGRSTTQTLRKLAAASDRREAA